MRTLVIAIAVSGIDLGSKTAAQAGILRGPWIQATANRDLALGIAGASTWTELSLGLATLLICVVALRRRPAGVPGAVAAGLMIGGSLGNLADRLLLGAVRDFIVGPFIVFNLADVALFVGVVVVLCHRAAPARKGALFDQEAVRPLSRAAGGSARSWRGRQGTDAQSQGPSIPR